MKDIESLKLALGLAHPWQIESCSLDAVRGRLDLRFDLIRGRVLICPQCGPVRCNAYDTEKRTWRHLNLIQYET
jgi:hypothetical protein